MQEPLSVLQQVFGHSSFRPGQEEIIRTIMEGAPVLAVLPTGAGKSLCYQIPALSLPGLCLVISPLISLMQDQVDKLQKAGIAAAFLNSSQSEQEQQSVYDNLNRAEIRILYLAPERITHSRLAELLTRIPVSLVAIDEAHCISQWGMDFRPAYRCIGSLLNRLPGTTRIVALTATATPEIRRDILQGLGIDSARVFTRSFDRPNLFLSVYQVQDRMNFLKDYVKNHKANCGVIYASTRRQVEFVQLQLQKAGCRAAAYHGALNEHKRAKAQKDFLSGRIRVMVATSAFGMGIDKPDVRYVIHYNLPGDLESYYQEAGRAGRDGNPAECILLYLPSDIRIQQFLIEQGSDETTRGIRMRRLQAMISYAQTTLCLRQKLLSYFDESACPEQCGGCSNCTERQLTDISHTARRLLNSANTQPQGIDLYSLCQSVRAETEASVSSRPDAVSPGSDSRAKWSRDAIRDCVCSLVDQGFLSLKKQRFYCTESGRVNLRQNKAIYARLRVSVPG